MKLWAGRFGEADRSLLDAFNASIHVDKRLYPHDIKGSKAHAKMLERIGVLTKEELELILEGLTAIKGEMDAGTFVYETAHEDIHMAVETALTEKIGAVAGKLHTARSRNDQVAVDVKLFLKEEIDRTDALLKRLIETLVERAKEHRLTILPGLTHLQKAQPIRLAFHLMAYAEMFKRDRQRLADLKERVSVMPLGSGALAGTSYASDRAFLCEELGFAEVSPNALDAVSDRDDLLDFLHDAHLIMMHLGRFCEEIILWATDTYGYITLSDAFTTGSSIMPQKKNPDAAELIRGKAAVALGRYSGFGALMKGLPLAYNKDLQEDKALLFAQVDDLQASLEIFEAMLATTTFHVETMRKACADGYLNATDLADYLVGKGLPFREAHHVVGSLVGLAVGEGIPLDDLPLDVLKEKCDLFGDEVYEFIGLEACVERRISRGGTSLAEVDAHIVALETYLEES
jgi:argininosuccinate lyase